MREGNGGEKGLYTGSDPKMFVTRRNRKRNVERRLIKRGGWGRKWWNVDRKVIVRGGVTEGKGGEWR